MDFQKSCLQIEKEISDKFHDKHFDSGILSDSYKRLGYQERSFRVLNCGTELSWRIPEDYSESPKLYHANFCKDRLCPMCSWRRTKKIYGQVSQVMDHLEGQYRYVFVTLTVRNCSADELSVIIDKMQNAFSLLRHYKRIKSAFKGYFKALEITRSPDHPPCWEYHPHFHCIFAVNKSYFKSNSYIKRDELAELWASAMGLNYYPQVDIRTVKDKDGTDGDTSIKKAVLEVAKYSVKSCDVLHGSNDQIDDVVYHLFCALAGRRMCSFGGAFKKAAQELKLDDMLDGDLVLTDGDKLRKDVAYLLVTYQWRVGFGYERAYARRLESEDMK
ncbi:MAG: replication protein [Ruminococcaceae bacterium]|nr:replication protein [Oscillospiraceae bacterium]